MTLNVLPDHRPDRRLTSNYEQVRRKEGRLFNDATVARLPLLPRAHPLSREWHLRRKSAQRLLAYLRHHRPKGAILDLGCGNGWLSHRLAALAGDEVVGLDIFEPELQQAARLFGERENLSFCLGDCFSASFDDRIFAVIVVAAAVQYFEDLDRLLGRLLSILEEGGQIHIFDSPFYEDDEIVAAQERTRKYYEALGFPEMIPFYHHHSRRILGAYRPRCLYDPGAPLRRLVHALLADSPFPWYCIRRTAGRAWP